MADKRISNGSISTEGGRVDPVKLEHRLTTLEQGIIRIEQSIGHLVDKSDDHDTWGRGENDRNQEKFASMSTLIQEARQHGATCSVRWDLHEDEHEHLKKRNIILDVTSGVLAFFAAIAAYVFGGNP